MCGNSALLVVWRVVIFRVLFVYGGGDVFGLIGRENILLRVV